MKLLQIGKIYQWESKIASKLGSSRMEYCLYPCCFSEIQFSNPELLKLNHFFVIEERCRQDSFYYKILTDLGRVGWIIIRNTPYDIAEFKMVST